MFLTGEGRSYQPGEIGKCGNENETRETGTSQTPILSEVDWEIMWKLENENVKIGSCTILKFPPPCGSFSNPTA